MSKLIYAEPDDEITNLVDRLRSERDETELVFVIPPSSRVMHSALNARLLMQYSNSLGKNSSVVTPDARTQSIALETGFTVFPSISAFEAGREIDEATGADASAPASAPVLAALPVGLAGGAGVERPQRAPTARQLAPRPVPSHRAVEPVPENRAGAAPYILAGIAAVIILVVVAVLVLPSATVTIISNARAISASPTINGSTAGPGPNDQLAIQTTLAQASESNQQQFPATGVKKVAAVSATGQVVISNSAAPCVDFPPGTQVFTDGGQYFITTQDTGEVGVAGSRNCPATSATVSVTARDGGVAGNVPAGAIKHINCGSINCEPTWTVNNPSPTTGGIDASQKTVISQADLDNAKNTLAGPLKDKVAADIAPKVANLKSLPETLSTTVDAQYDHKLNDESTNFNATVTVKQNVVAIDENKLHAVMLNALKKTIPADYVLTSDPPKYTYQVAQHDEVGNIVIDGTAAGFQTPAIDINALRAAISGKSAAKARQYVLGHVDSTDVVISQSPAFIPWLPLIADRIRIRQQVENSSG